jgi:hypothetical protein
VEEAVKIVKGKGQPADDRFLKGTRVYTLGKGTSQKQTQTEKTYTAVLLACQCRSEKDRLEEI